MPRDGPPGKPVIRNSKHPGIDQSAPQKCLAVLFYDLAMPHDDAGEVRRENLIQRSAEGIAI